MPFFMKEFGVLRAMYPDRPEVSYIPRGLVYKTEKMKRNPDGRAYKVVGSNYSDASNWADIIPMPEKEEEEAAPAETKAVVEEPVVEEKEAAPVETEAAVVEEPVLRKPLLLRKLLLQRLKRPSRKWLRR